MTSRISATEDLGRRVARNVIHKFFTTQSYPYTKHHIDSYDQFLSTDLSAIFRANNPIRVFKDRIPDKNRYNYSAEIFIGGLDGTECEIGTPVVNLDNSEDVRLLFPNEARLRNLTYASTVKVNIVIKFTYTEHLGGDNFREEKPDPIVLNGVSLFKIPIMLHSRYCQLHDKPREFLTQAGECQYDNGGYFIIDGSEKVLISRQERAFNTLYITKKDNDEKFSCHAYITCLSAKTRGHENVSFVIRRSNNVIYAEIPMVRAPINVFTLFRALGIQSDEAIVRLIFPDLASADAQFLADKLIPTIIDSYPFLTTKMAIDYIKSVTKGFSVETVLDILRNRFFVHIENTPGARATYLAECIRSLLKVAHGFEPSTNKDDTRNQRCLTSGFLIQDLFNDSYKIWMKAIKKNISEEYNYHKQIYSGLAFMNIFAEGNRARIFRENFITDMLLRAFKGKWGTGMGEEKTGVLQALSRLSYLDFMSHCRRVVLKFDTSEKTPGPRHLHASQYGYFCTNETPSGASIGITKNLSILTTISTGMNPEPLVQWLYDRGGVATCASVNADEKAFYVPVYVNNGIIGYTSGDPTILVRVLKAMKLTGFLPPFVSVGFSYSQRRIFIYCDEGRPIRPLIIIGKDKEVPSNKIAQAKSWRDLIMGSHPARSKIPLSFSTFTDPLADRQGDRPTAENYLNELEQYAGTIEYVDPYEQNEIFIANFPEHIISETTHMEIHPSTMFSIMTSLIPYANHNQSPRNQLSCSQSKQSIGVYATNYKNRYDNSGLVGFYGEAPVSRTLYYDYMAEGRIPYGNNCIMAIAMYEGYNQDDGFVVNKDALDRGLFRTAVYRSYEFYEEDDEKTGLKKRIGNPAKIGAWLDLKPGLDYLKLDDRGIVRVGEYVDEDTVIIGGYYQPEKDKYKDASMTPKVWTRGIVDDVVVTVNNKGLRLVKVRVVQDRTPVLGDKFSNRHGQKGTIGMIKPATDMPRAGNGIVPDIIANPHAIPSRMTMAMLLEALLGKAAASHGAIGDATTFMNQGNPSEVIGAILEKQYGYERYCNEVLYDGITGKQMECAIFIGPTYYMRLKHMTEDKWNARGAGRKEAKTHQPTGGRGNEGGLKIGEMDRDAIICHGISGFVRETFMERSDGDVFPVCAGCGTMPIYNEKQNIAVCTMCQGPIKFAGTSADTLEMIPPMVKPVAPIVKVEMPYTVKLLDQELATFGNMSMRYITRARADKLGSKYQNIIEPGTGPVEDLPSYKIPEVNVPHIEELAATSEKIAASMPNLENLATLAKQVGMTLVPEGSAMARGKPQIPLGMEPLGPPETGEKIVEGSTAEEGVEGPPEEEEVQILPGAIPPTPELKVLGSKAPITVPQVVPAAPMMTNEQMANVLINAAIQSPQVLAAAANQVNQALMPAGPTVVVDTSPRALAAEGLLMQPLAQAPSEGLRVARRRAKIPMMGGGLLTESAAAPAPAPKPTGQILVNKLG